MKTFKKELKAFKKQISDPKANTETQGQTEDETFSFADAMQGVKPLTQDKVEPDKRVELFEKSQQVSGRNIKHSKQLAASFHFSDMYQAALPQEGPMRFCQEGESTHILKQLTTGRLLPRNDAGFTRVNPRDGKSGISRTHSYREKRIGRLRLCDAWIWSGRIESRSTPLSCSAPTCSCFSPSTARIRRPSCAFGTYQYAAPKPSTLAFAPSQ